jgi:hypothetical protein
MSETYLLASAADLQAVVTLPAHRPDRFAILCSGAREFGALSPYVLPSDARLQNKVGGALGSLNIRVARLLIETTNPSEWSREKLRRLVATWLEDQPVRVRYDRKPISDDDVRTAIRRSLKSDPGARPTPLLRELRASGQACEHSRFVRLFNESVRSINGKP